MVNDLPAFAQRRLSGILTTARGNRTAQIYVRRINLTSDLTGMDRLAEDSERTNEPARPNPRGTKSRGLGAAGHLSLRRTRSVLRRSGNARGWEIENSIARRLVKSPLNTNWAVAPWRSRIGPGSMDALHEIELQTKTLPQRMHRSAR